VGETCLVDSVVDLASPPGLTTTLANLAPRGRNVGDTGELGDEGVDSGINSSWGIEWFRGEVESFGLRGNKVPVHRATALAWRFGGSLAAFQRRSGDLNELGAVIRAFIA
jgi:hypothetical protein